MKDLRNPKTGCPWDVEQHFASIAPHTLEEAYEVVDAIERDSMEELKGELGDLLFQVIFHSQLASEEGLFDMEDVIDSVTRKMIFRHPHVFGDDTSIKTADDQERAWEVLKAKEKPASHDESVLANVPVGLPATTRAYKLQKKAAKVGFDWPDLSGVFAKIAEELAEVQEAIESGDSQSMLKESGDVMFAVVNLLRKIGVDPETALRATNQKFTQRFSYIEQQLARNGVSIDDATLEEMDGLWEEAKMSCE